MEQLIKITTVPIEYEFKINDAKYERRSGTAELEISRNEGGMQIRSKPVKLNLDTYDARNSVVPTTATSISQAAESGKHAAYSATAQFAGEGKMMLHAKIGEGGEALAQVFANRAAQPQGDFELGFIPTTGPEISWDPPELSIQYQMDKLQFDAKIFNGNIEFIPGSFELNVTQHADVVIDYVGEPIYVPKSANPNYSGEIIDLEA